MKGLIQKLRRTDKTDRPESSYKFYEFGFHGDNYLLALVDHLVTNNVNYFIETGTNVGSTLAYAAKKYPQLQCYSCEPDTEAFTRALSNTRKLKNVKIFNMLSQDFMIELKQKNQEIFQHKVLIWLDAHSYGFDWPLQQEMHFFSENFENCYLMIDDFKVPHLNVFNYDRYMDQLCAHEYIKDFIAKKSYELYYPDYTEKTSAYHPLQGWGLYVFGEKLMLTKKLENNVKKAD